MNERERLEFAVRWLDARLVAALAATLYAGGAEAVERVTKRTIADTPLWMEMRGHLTTEQLVDAACQNATPQGAAPGRGVGDHG